MAEQHTKFMPEWIWWTKGECVVKVISIGHFPTTIMAMTPDDKTIEIDMVELENIKGDR